MLIFTQWDTLNYSSSNFTRWMNEWTLFCFLKKIKPNNKYGVTFSSKRKYQLSWILIFQCNFEWKRIDSLCDDVKRLISCNNFMPWSKTRGAGHVFSFQIKWFKCKEWCLRFVWIVCIIFVSSILIIWAHNREIETKHRAWNCFILRQCLKKERSI